MSLGRYETVILWASDSEPASAGVLKDTAAIPGKTCKCPWLTAKFERKY